MDIRELCCLLKYAETTEEIDGKWEGILGLLPAAEIMIDYDQQNWTHQYDLWQHSLHTVLGVPRGIDDDMLYLAALLHDAGKPQCQTQGERDGKPNMHYYGEKPPACEKRDCSDAGMEWGVFVRNRKKAAVLLRCIS